MIQILYILIVTSIACSILGVFLVLRNLAMLSDAISHSVLLGIVLAFFVVRDLSSIYLIIAAGLSGVLSCICIEALSKSRKISNDAAVGIVFPLFFSLAVILISKYAKNVHLDTDMVLTGELTLAPFDTISLLGMTLPKSLVVMSIMVVVNVIYVAINFRTLSISTFDPTYANTVGISMGLLYYSLMTMISMTAVASFTTVGAILSISFFICPAASAYLITKKIKMTILVAILYAIINSVIAYFTAIRYNVSISGMCAGISGITFMLTFLFYKDGFITRFMDRHRKKVKFKKEMLILHMANHTLDSNMFSENGMASMKYHLAWNGLMLKNYISRLISAGYVYEDKKKGIYVLTDKGMELQAQIKRTYGL